MGRRQRYDPGVLANRPRGDLGRAAAAWIQTGRFDGIDKSRIVDRTESHALPVRAVAEAIAFVRMHMIHGPEILAVLRLSIFDDLFVVENLRLLPIGLAVEDL